MYAVFKLSGFQYTAQEGDVLKVPHQNIDGNKIDITDVMMIKENDNAIIGSPYIDNAKIEAELLGHGKDDKVLIYKYKRRTKYRRTQGHRQDYTEIKINKIVAP